jgi:transposase-like protein
MAWIMSVLESREMRGKMIAQKPNQIQRLDERFYKVASQSREIMYYVVRTKAFAIGWICNCPDITYRQTKCKHIWAVEFSLALRYRVHTVWQQVTIRPVDLLACRFCASKMVVKDAKRFNRYGEIQRYFCKACGKRFSFNLGFERMQASPEAITSAMQLYFTGESLRNVQKFLRLKGVEVTHVAVYKWIGKYVSLMENYLRQIEPQVSNTWRADELFLKVKGNMKYLYALMDDETRFWIAQQVADTKYTADITPLFKEGKELTGKAPSTIITDGAYNFESAFRSAFPGENEALAIRHERHVRMSGDLNNQKMERLNGEIREKVVRGMKKPDSPLLTGYQLYHNYVRPHEALDGRTPADLAGITIEGQNKWMTLIQNAKADSIGHRKARTE